MDRKYIRQEIRNRINCESYLEKSKSSLFCCPYCGSGKGKHGTGALKLYETNTWTCHACKKSGDVIDLYQQEMGIDYNTALSLLADKIGMPINLHKSSETTSHIHTSQNIAQKCPQSDFNKLGYEDIPPEAKASKNDLKMPVIDNVDYTLYYQECNNLLNDPSAIAYLKKRGISFETAHTYFIGYDPISDPANSPGGIGQPKHPCPRIIIPTSKTHFVGRRIDGERDFEKVNSKGSSPEIFNSQALLSQETQEIFVVEGAFDALSILEVGYKAIALNSAGNFEALLKHLEQYKTSATLILCPDNDTNPQTADRIKKEFETLASGLERLNISHITADINGNYKDANEHLVNNKESFIEALRQAQRMTVPKPDNTQYYIDMLMSDEIERFKVDKKTGFKNLDKETGGLYEGLYILAAISSLGKTSFALQLADQLAEYGQDVIFFSLEQSKLELVSKSISRRTVTKDIFGNLEFENAVTSLEIRKGVISQQVQQAANEYKTAISNRISIVEGNFCCSVSYIDDYIRQYIRRNKTRPVIFIDYLQILQASEDTQRQSTKETVDSAIKELKRLSHNLNLTVIVISSVNRMNYLNPIDFESLKESGSIEFSCDVLWGLQLQCLNSNKFEKAYERKKREIVKEAKIANPRKIELSCLKNRYGIANYSCYFDYYPSNDLFIEDTGEENDIEWESIKTI